MSTSRLSFRFLMLVTAFGTACGSEPPRVRSAEPSSMNEAASANQPGANSAPAGSQAGQGGNDSVQAGGQCDPGCAKLLSAAGSLLAQAEAIKGESKAKTALYERAGDVHVRAWRGCDLSRPRGQDLGCSGASELIPNMVKAFAEKGREDGAMFAYLVALDPRYRLQGDSATANASDELTKLAERAEADARQQPKATHVAEALAMAAYARLRTGDAAQAERDVALLGQSFARESPEEATLAAAALAMHYVEQGSWEKALAALTPTASLVERTPARVKIVWTSARGRALAGLGRQAAAARDFEQAIRVWGSPEPRDYPSRLGHTEPSPRLGREQVVDAVGVAHFSLGEQQRLAAEKLSMPPYQGPRSVAGVNQYVKGPVAAWIVRRQKLLEDAQARYRAIANIKPVVPPRWLVAGAAMTGQGYNEFADQFASAKIPAPVAADADMRAAYTRALSEVEKQLRERAKQSFEYCSKTAEKLGVSDQQMPCTAK